MEEKTVFWADEIAEKIINRKKFHYLEQDVPKLKKWVVKSSSSLSGILHIGRLSDIIRSEAEALALEKQGFPVDFIYVTEDMDPLRKIPAGVPKEFREFIGMPVSDLPDPDGCHKSYAEHHMQEFLQVLKKFLILEPTLYSMREEYKKGNFTESVQLLAKNREAIKEIMERVQGSTVEDTWAPYKPICKKCGKLQTTVITKVEGNKILYKCQDYAFETETAKGCGFEGEADLLNPNGKLVWKGEWAAQWKRWGVCSEGAGKEYESANSSFWVNTEISEKILGFPMPEPIFYEHIMVNGEKMSASKGNVVYPKDWLEVSKPETLKYLYMKKLMRARSFEWKNVPVLELELDRVLENKENDEKNKRYEETIKVSGRAIKPLKADYAICATLGGMFPANLVEEKLKEMNLWEEDKKELLKERIKQASTWVEKYSPEQKISFAEKIDKTLFKGKENLFKSISEKIASKKEPKEIQDQIYNAAKETNTPLPEAFKALYLALIGKERGPRIGELIIVLGKEKALARIKELSN